jgi:hypothetical protein
MDRRTALKALLKAAITGTALTATGAAAQVFGPNKYQEVLRLQQDIIAFHLAVKDRMDMQGGNIHTNASYQEKITPKIDHLLGYSMDHFTGDTTSQEAKDACDMVFNRWNEVDAMSEAGLRKLAEVIIPVAIARNLLARYRVTFNPSKTNNWDRFSDRYQDLILAA